MPGQRYHKKYTWIVQNNLQLFEIGMEIVNVAKLAPENPCPLSADVSKSKTYIIYRLIFKQLKNQNRDDNSKFFILMKFYYQLIKFE